MPLVLETGAGVANANTFVALADAQEFADLRGLSVTMTDGLLVSAADALATVAFKGRKVAAGNLLPWPRADVCDLFGETIASDVIPNQIVMAQLWAAYYISQGSDPSVVSGPAVKREKVDVLEVEYATFEGQKTAQGVLSLPYVRNALSGLVATASGRIERV